MSKPCPPRSPVRSSWITATVLGAALGVSGCTVGPDFVRPQDPAVKAYANEEVGPTAADSSAAKQGFALGERIRGDWWELFRAPKLSEVLQQAIADNLTVAAARATLAQAREVVTQTGGPRYPQLGFASSVNRQGKNFAGSGLDQKGPTENFFSIGPTASYS